MCQYLPANTALLREGLRQSPPLHRLHNPNQGHSVLQQAVGVSCHHHHTSLIIASMRYFFIVHNEMALLLGKQRMKRIFELLNVMVPLGMTVSHACTLPVPPSAYNTAQKTCYEFLEVSHNMTCRDSNGITDNCAPILPIVIERIPTVVTTVAFLNSVVW